MRSFFGPRAKGLDIDRLIEIARSYLEAETPAIGALRDKLQEHMPDQDKQAMAYAVRSYLPLVQVPPIWRRSFVATWLLSVQRV